MRKNFYGCVLLLFILFAKNGAAQTQSGGEKSKYSIFLIGDTGDEDSLRKGSNFALLKSSLVKADTNSCLIFLGDDIYPRGMPDSGNVERKIAEARISTEIALSRNFKGRVFFIPGNHDWDQGRPDGWDRIKNETEFI